jgi:hypothetical protein
MERQQQAAAANSSHVSMNERDNAKRNCRHAGEANCLWLAAVSSVANEKYITADRI